MDSDEIGTKTATGIITETNSRNKRQHLHTHPVQNSPILMVSPIQCSPLIVGKWNNSELFKASNETTVKLASKSPLAKNTGTYSQRLATLSGSVVFAPMASQFPWRYTCVQTTPGEQRVVGKTAPSLPLTKNTGPNSMIPAPSFSSTQQVLAPTLSQLRQTSSSDDPHLANLLVKLFTHLKK